MPLGQFDERVPECVVNVLDHGSAAATPISLGWLSALASRIDSWVMTSTDTVAHNITVGIYVSATMINMGTIEVPAGAGNGTVPAVDVLQTLFGSANHYLLCTAGQDVAVSIDALITSTKEIDVTLMGGQF